MEYLIHVCGLVQGVGFRPYVCRLAGEMGLAGSVDNGTGEGVTRVSPDIAVCDACLDDMIRQSRRSDYPFVNCTSCGPRFSIIKDLPYDRPATTMASFAMCPECAREYEDETDRRFHAQPIACNHCGPHYTLREKSGTVIDDYPTIRRQLATVLSGGGVVALKGIGGYNLICDPFSPMAVRRLRVLKERPHKPFAVMVPDMETARRFVFLSKREEAVLSSWRRPILLARQRRVLASAINEGYCTLGLMLPFQPVHYHIFSDSGLKALVFTSGNKKGFPLCADDDEAVVQLLEGTDILVAYNRNIYNRVDDSVVRVIADAPRLLRRARGYVPDPLPADMPVEGVFAAGAERTNHFAIGKGSEIILSPYIGTLRDCAVADLYGDTLTRYTRLFRFEPRLVVCDKHPDYFSTRFAESYAAEHGLPLVRVQHHHAHAVAVMAEYRLSRPVLAICLDGTGAGDDGRIWGGEFLWVDRCSYRRLLHFPYLSMPGGDAAAREPWRMAVAVVRAFSDGLYPSGFCKRVGDERVRLVERMILSPELSPQTSAVGRLFDAVSSLLGICDKNSYESEAAVLLEQVALGAEIKDKNYPVDENSPLNLTPLFISLLRDLQAGCKVADIAYAFHATLAEIVFMVAAGLLSKENLSVVVLSGGVFQNKILSELLLKRFSMQGITAYLPEQMPVHDGAIAVGQVVIASARGRLT